MGEESVFQKDRTRDKSQTIDFAILIGTSIINYLFDIVKP